MTFSSNLKYLQSLLKEDGSSVADNISSDGGNHKHNDSDDEEFMDKIDYKRNISKDKLYHVVDLKDDEYVHLEGIKMLKLKDLLEADKKPKSKGKSKPKKSVSKPKDKPKAEPKEAPPASSNIQPSDKPIPSLAQLAQQAQDEPDDDMFKDFPKFSDASQEPDFSEPLEPQATSQASVEPAPTPEVPQRQFPQAGDYGQDYTSTPFGRTGHEYTNASSSMPKLSQVAQQAGIKPRKPQEPPKQTPLQKAASAVGKAGKTIKQKAGDIFKKKPKLAGLSTAQTGLKQPEFEKQANIPDPAQTQAPASASTPQSPGSLLGSLSTQKYGHNKFLSMDPKWKAGMNVDVGGFKGLKVIEKTSNGYIVGKMFPDNTLHAYIFKPGAGMDPVDVHPAWYKLFPGSKPQGK